MCFWVNLALSAIFFFIRGGGEGGDLLRAVNIVQASKEIIGVRSSCCCMFRAIERGAAEKHGCLNESPKALDPLLRGKRATIWVWQRRLCGGALFCSALRCSGVLFTVRNACSELVACKSICPHGAVCLHKRPGLRRSRT